MRQTFKVMTIALLLIGVIVSPLFATGTSEERDDAQVTLTIWEHAPQFEAPLKASVGRFMEMNPDINVEYEVKTSEQYYNLLFTSIQAGAAPDLFWTHGTKTEYLEQIVEQGAVMDLTGKIDVSNYPKMQADVAYVDGKLYMNPGASVGTRAVYYNKDIFSEYGLEIPETMADFRELSRTLLENGVTPMSTAGGDFWAILFHFEPMLAALAPDYLEEATQERIRLNDPRVVEVMNEMVAWGEQGWYGRDYLGVDTGGALLAFSSSRVAMTITGSWNADTIQKNNPALNVGAFQLPTEDGVAPMIVTPDSGFSIYSGTEHPEEAVRLIQWLNSVEAQQIWVNEMGLVPGLSEIEAVNELVREIATHDVQVESYYTLLGMYPAKGNVIPRKVFEEDLQKVLSGALTPEQLLLSMEAEVDWDAIQ